MVENFITINGMPGTGKTELALLLQEQEGYEVISAYDLHRSIANKLKIDTEEFMDLLSSNTQVQKRYDKMINRAIREKESELTGKKVVFNTRASFSLIKNAVHVLLTAEEDIIADRLYERYKNLSLGHTEIKERILKLTQKETSRFSRQLNADYLNPVYYNIVVDTSLLTLSDVKKVVLHKSQEIMTKKSMEQLDELVSKRRF